MRGDGMVVEMPLQAPIPRATHRTAVGTAEFPEAASQQGKYSRICAGHGGKSQFGLGIQRPAGCIYRLFDRHRGASQ